MMKRFLKHHRSCKPSDLQPNRPLSQILTSEKVESFLKGVEVKVGV